jgi:hypothetical protein
MLAATTELPVSLCLFLSLWDVMSLFAVDNGCHVVIQRVTCHDHLCRSTVLDCPHMQTVVQLGLGPHRHCAVRVCNIL